MRKINFEKLSFKEQEHLLRKILKKATEITQIADLDVPMPKKLRFLEGTSREFRALFFKGPKK